jgi:hypothetical protein
MRGRIAGLAILLAVTACGGKSPAAPTVPACQQNNTAELTFGNRSTSNTTYDVMLNGSRVTTVAPGNNSSPYTLAAGTAHSVSFRITNTTIAACNTASPNLAQCTSQTLTCAF